MLPAKAELDITALGAGALAVLVIIELSTE